MKLYKVRDDKHLHWPKEIDQKDKLWLGPGGVVDLDDPFVAQSVKGQEYKLEPVEDRNITRPTPITHQRFTNLRAAYLNAGKPEAHKEVHPDPEGARDIPRPDVRPTAGKEKRNA